jgi:hypothetical protein
MISPPAGRADRGGYQWCVEPLSSLPSDGGRAGWLTKGGQIPSPLVGEGEDGGEGGWG